MKHLFLCLLICLSYGGLIQGQTEIAPSQISPNGVIPCVAMETQKLRQLQNPAVESLEDFERWLTPLKEAMARGEWRSTGCNGVPEIGVVFHIIHNGEAVGNGANINASVVNAQLNQMNTDLAGLIDFCLAGMQESGDAMPELGINRINRFDMGWPNDILDVCDEVDGAIVSDLSQIENVVKPTTQWDPERYLNVWVIPMECTPDRILLGYAQFPVSAGITGIPPGVPAGADTDGIVLLTNTLGSDSQPNPNPIPLASAYAQGGTMSHELGHFLGLLHIWGEGRSCDSDDYCDDTPLAMELNFSCPNKYTCGSFDMVENHMDYTTDACRHLFTPCQELRMQTVLANSPRRINLCTSGVCCVETATVKFRIEDVDGNPEKDFCAGDKVFIDASTTTGEVDYALEVYSRILDGGTAYNLVHDFGWTNGVIPNQIDIGDLLSSVGVAMKGGFEYRINISVNGSCGIISKTKRFRYHPSHIDVIIDIQDANGIPTNSFCFGDEVLADATSTMHVTSYRYRILRRPLLGTNTQTYYSSIIFSGEPGLTNVSDLFLMAGLTLDEGYEYTFAIDAWGKCFESNTGMAYFTVNNCPPACDPPENLHCEEFFGTTRLAWNPVIGATGYELSITVNDFSCACGLGAVEDRFPMVNTAYYELPADLVAACFSWKVKAFCETVESPQYSASNCYAPNHQCDIIGLQQSERDQLLLRDLSVYPNPSAGRIMVELPLEMDTEIQLRIFDLNGRLIYQSKKNWVPQGLYREALDLESHLEEGLYFLDLQSATDTYRQRLMILK